MLWLGQAGAQLATAVLFAVVARSGDPAAFGRAATCYGLALAGAQVVDLGAQQRLLRDAAVGRLSAGRLRSLVVTKPLAALAVGPLVVLAIDGVAGSLVAAVAAWMYAVLRSEVLAAQALWQVRDRAALSSAMTVAERVIAALAGGVLAASGVGSAEAVMLGLLAGVGLVAVPAAWSTFPAAGGRGGGSGLLDGLRFGRHYAPVSLAANLLLLDVVVVGAVAGQVEAGHFGLGSRLLGPLLVVTTALCTAIVPAAARRDVSLRRPFVVVTAVTLGVLFAVVGTAPWLVRVSAGAEYASAVPAVRMYAVAAAVVALAQPVSSWLQARGEERFVSRVLPTGIAAGLVLTGAGAAVGGAAGGAAGQAVACVAVTVLLGRRLRSVRSSSRDGRQAQAERQCEVPAGRVAERGEEHMPHRHHEHEGLGQ